MNIILLNPDLFVSYKNKIGLTLFIENDQAWFCNGTGLPLECSENDLEPVTDFEIIEELTQNNSLLQLALLHHAVELQERDDVEYLSYCTSYD